MRMMMIAAMVAGMASPAVAARQGVAADTSYGTVAITASVAAQARLTGDGDTVCLWSNTATRLLAVTAADAAGTAHPLTPGDGMVAAETPGCASGGRLTLAALHAGGDPRMILVSPE